MPTENTDIGTDAGPDVDALTGESDSGEDTVELLGQDGDAEPGTAQSPSTDDQLRAATAEGHRSATLQKLIDEKYGGSEAEMVKAVYEQQNSTARVFQELKALREEMASRNTPVQEPEPETDPDLSSLNDQRAMVIEELEALNTTHSEIIAVFNRLGEEKVEVRTRASLSDDYDKPKYEDRLVQIDRQMNDLKRTFNGLPREARRLQVQLGQVDRNIRSAHGAIQTRSQAQKQQQEQDKQAQSHFRGSVEQYISSVANEKGIAEGTKVHARMGDYVRRSVIAHLSALDPDGPGIDPVAAARHFSSEFLDGLSEGSRMSFKTASLAKQSAQSPAQRHVPGARPVRVRELTREQIEAHKTAVLGT